MSVCEVDRAGVAAGIAVGARALLPVSLDLSRLRVAVVGRALGALRRLDLLDAAHADQVTVYADRAAGILQVRAGDRLVSRLPTAAELARVDVLFLTDLGPAEAQPLADHAHAGGALVNIEDDLGRCDFLPTDAGTRASARPAAAREAAAWAAEDPLRNLPAHIWAF